MSTRMLGTTRSLPRARKSKCSKFPIAPGTRPRLPALGRFSEPGVQAMLAPMTNRQRQAWNAYGRPLGAEHLRAIRLGKAIPATTLPNGRGRKALHVITLTAPPLSESFIF